MVSATIIFLVGAFIARVVGDAVSAISARSDIPSGQVLGQAIRYSLLLLVVVLALDELGVQTTILTTLIIVAVAAIALGLALSFGLGNRQLARGIMAGFHAREEYTAGQRITVGGYTGRLLRIGATKTHMETSEGRISIPNTMLLDEVVKIYPGFDGVEDSNAETNSSSEDKGGK